MKAVEIVDVSYKAITQLAKIPLLGPLVISPLMIITTITDLAISKLIYFTQSKKDPRLEKHIKYLPEGIGVDVKNTFSLGGYLWWQSQQPQTRVFLTNRPRLDPYLMSS